MLKAGRTVAISNSLTKKSIQADSSIGISESLSIVLYEILWKYLRK